MLRVVSNFFVVALVQEKQLKDRKGRELLRAVMNTSLNEVPSLRASCAYKQCREVVLVQLAAGL